MRLASCAHGRGVIHSFRTVGSRSATAVLVGGSLDVSSRSLNLISEQSNRCTRIRRQVNHKQPGKRCSQPTALRHRCGPDLTASPSVCLRSVTHRRFTARRLVFWTLRHFGIAHVRTLPAASLGDPDESTAPTRRPIPACEAARAAATSNGPKRWTDLSPRYPHPGPAGVVPRTAKASGRKASRHAWSAGRHGNCSTAGRGLSR